MARYLLDDAKAESHGSAEMDRLAGGAWLGIGLSCGFVLGIITYALVAWYIRRRQNPTPNSQVRPSSQRASATGGFSNLAHDLRTTTSSSNLTAPPQPGKQTSSENLFFSPLQSSMAKATNMRGSTNAASLPDPALYGSHGFALLQAHPTSMGAATMQPAALLETDAAAAPEAVSTSNPPASPFAYSTPLANRPTSQPSGRDTADQGLQARQAHQRMVSVADAYGADDLDDEWAVVLGDLDGLLVKKGHPGLASPERAVAVRRLIAVTGSRGMQFALDAALQDVIRYRAKQQ